MRTEKSQLNSLNLWNIGAIEFGIVFVPALEEDQQQSDLEVETIEEMGRIRSDLQTISGSFTPPSEGVVFFLWDNTYVHFLFFMYLSSAVDCIDNYCVHGTFICTVLVLYFILFIFWNTVVIDFFFRNLAAQVMWIYS